MIAKKYLDRFVSKMKNKGLPRVAVEAFAFHYNEAASGETGLMPESSISPVSPDEIKNAGNLEKCHDSGKEALKKSAAIILNGGLGTSMGLVSTKSLIPVKEGK